MAKTFRKPVDKFERQARLAEHRTVRDTEHREIRNMHRIGWVPDMEENDDSITGEDTE